MSERRLIGVTLSVLLDEAPVEDRLQARKELITIEHSLTSICAIHALLYERSHYCPLSLSLVGCWPPKMPTACLCACAFHFARLIEPGRRGSKWRKHRSLKREQTTTSGM